ncbi:unnamed protein product (macronuclear) [Paramecium tetraurelia]|uniref:C2 domain-containing protein n=1 Tax=Paramecium tetraurelia TaxID=5888 RepID=A0BL85_PARTE|nr:uncharacterized protein GSPATT00029934001 [Paramecium tetraurelia]CAK59302.1 unnamed protein product [Paramecium tetraurelia]|eukprot:XP_001426700.1 hypothetical protein (macronuclear) [Paramecium tetraurelia strain d4-2]
MPTSVNAIEKANVLRKEFLEIEINHDELLSIEQFYRCLDKKLRRQFDRELGDQLYQRMNKSFNNKVTVDEFIKVFLQAEEILKNKIEGCKKQILDYNKQRKYVSNQFDSIKDSERVNQYGIKEDSYLTVELLEGVNFPAQNVSVILKLENQKQEIQQQNGPSPQWNKTLNFKISTGLEELQLFFYTINHPNIPQLLGTVTLSLSHLTNQTKIEDCCQLFNKNGQQTQTKIKLRSQWIFNESKSLCHQIEVCNDQIKTAQDDLIDFEKDLATLYEPFPNYVQLIRSIEKEDLAINHQPPNTLVMTPINNVSSQYDYKLYTRLSILVVMGLSVFICFGKSQFLDLVICFFFIIEFEFNRLYKQRLIYYSIAVGISLLCDLVWAIKYSRGFWGSEDSETDKYYVIEKGPNRLALILLFVSFIFKLILCALLGALSQDMPEQLEEQLPNKNKSTKQQSFYSKNKTAQFGEDNSTFYNY